MSLSVKEKIVVKDFFQKLTGRKEEIGAEALSRMVAVYPQTKSYFAHWKDVSATSTSVRKHGVTIMSGVFDAVGNIDDMVGGMLTLSELHAFMLRIDPFNFKILIHCMLVVMSMLCTPEEFTPKIHLAVDKFLALVALALSEKYR